MRNGGGKPWAMRSLAHLSKKWLPSKRLKLCMIGTRRPSLSLGFGLNILSDIVMGSFPRTGHSGLKKQDILGVSMFALQILVNSIRPNNPGWVFPSTVRDIDVCTDLESFSMLTIQVKTTKMSRVILDVSLMHVDLSSWPIKLLILKANRKGKSKATRDVKGYNGDVRDLWPGLTVEISKSWTENTRHVVLYCEEIALLITHLYWKKEGRGCIACGLELIAISRAGLSSELSVGKWLKWASNEVHLLEGAEDITVIISTPDAF